MADISQQELEEAFKLFDADGDGKINGEELKALVDKVGGNMTAGEADALIRKADKDGDKEIDMSEFGELWAAIRGDGEAEMKIKAEFLKMDGDRSGYITKEEMLTIVGNCPEFDGDKAAEAAKCVAELDVDKDGKVSYPEFLLVWKFKKNA